MSSVREALLKGAQILDEAGITEPQENAWQLLSFVSGMDRGAYLMRQREPFSQEEEYLRLIALRTTHRPLQYITGSQEFMGLTFCVTPDVLIPRQDTETLVEEALKEIKKAGPASHPLQVMDVCTGSGCIGISLNVFLKRMGIRAKVTCSDISSAALAVAGENAERICREEEAEPVSFLQSDLLSEASAELDIIVSNPPYIRSDVIDTLMEEVKDHEPRLALDGEADGLAFYRRLSETAPFHLKEGGLLLYEIGFDQGEAVAALLSENGFTDIKIIKDLSGNDRVVKGRLSTKPQ